MAERFDFSSAVGKGSRSQVVGFILPMIFSTSCCVTCSKEHRGWAHPWLVLSEGAGRGRGLERLDRMVLTFPL